MTYKIDRTFGNNIKVTDMEMVVGYERRKDICGMSVTLDGKPATVSGAMTKFAVVRELGGTASFEWNWETAARIAKKDGKFTS